MFLVTNNQRFVIRFDVIAISTALNRRQRLSLKKSVKGNIVITVIIKIDAY